MKIGHRFSFFIFQLAEKMNDPKIHAFERRLVLQIINFSNNIFVVVRRRTRKAVHLSKKEDNPSVLKS